MALIRNNSFIIYIIALLITLGVFGGALFTSSYINTRKTDELKAIEDKITLDLIVTETQLSSFTETSCQTFNSSTLREELDNLSARLNFMEDQVGKDNADIFRLKRYYTQLQIRDFTLTKKMSDNCKSNKIFIFYFYASKTPCADCASQEYILKSIAAKYKQAEIYHFDYDLDRASLKPFIANIPTSGPFISINNVPYPLFTNLEAMTRLIDAIASSTATTTIKK